MLQKASVFSKNRSFIRAVFLCLILILPGCAKVPLDLRQFAPPHEENVQKGFYVCRAYGCYIQTPTKLNEQEWASVKTILQQKTDTAEQERIHLGQAIARIEKITGQKIGTHRDVGGATMRGHGPYQLDCIDEAINTSKYLDFIAQENLLKFHDIGKPARRGTFIDGAWPHNTAVIIERESGAGYAIDSWFFDNGQPPAIVPLELWLDGWEPPEEG